MEMKRAVQVKRKDTTTLIGAKLAPTQGNTIDSQSFALTLLLWV